MKQLKEPLKYYDLSPHLTCSIDAMQDILKTMPRKQVSRTPNFPHNKNHSIVSRPKHVNPGENRHRRNLGGRDPELRDPEGFSQTDRGAKRVEDKRGIAGNLDAKCSRTGKNLN